jgi:hypothetical protein
VQLYELLKDAFGNEEAQTFVNILEEKISQSKNDHAIKEEIIQLKEAVVSLESNMREDMAAARAELLSTIYFVTVIYVFALLAAVVSLYFLLKK